MSKPDPSDLASAPTAEVAARARRVTTVLASDDPSSRDARPIDDASGRAMERTGS